MPGVCDAEADRRRGYKGRGIIIPKDKFKEFVEFQKVYSKRAIEIDRRCNYVGKGSRRKFKCNVS